MAVTRDCRVAAVGIDACKGGWVAVVLRAGRPAEGHFLREIADAGVAVPDAEAMAVDIPIGLPDGGTRQADLEAKRLLGPRQISVFLTPVRAALTEPTHAAATAAARRETDSGISQQAFALRAKIFEVEQWLPDAPCGVWEVHPEVSFFQLLGRPASATKRSWHGIVERRRALAGCGIVLEDVDPVAGSIAAADDVLDAAVAAWSARRILSGDARSLPDPPERDPEGRPMAIWI